jgi:hypothetical protein
LSCRLSFRGTVVARAGEQSGRLVSGIHVAWEAVEEARILGRNAVGEGRGVRIRVEDFAERHLSEAESMPGELYCRITEARAELN